MEIITNNQIQVVQLNEQVVKFTKTEDGQYALCSDDVFQYLFDRNKYRHLNNIEALGIDAKTDAGQKVFKFYSIKKHEQYLLEYRVRQKAYNSSIQNETFTYRNYKRFLSDGGVQNLYDLCCKQDGVDSTENYESLSSDYLEKYEQALDQENNESTDVEKMDHADDAMNYMTANSMYDDTKLDERFIVKEKPETPPEPTEQVTTSRLRQFVTNKDVFLWSTILLTAIFIPFTYSALSKYVTVGDGGFWTYITPIMCLGMAIAFDWSIMVFSVNGKHKLANIGGLFQIIFISVHFDIISELHSEDLQTMVTKICAVVYGAILLNQFSKLSMKNG